jgi:hypothetical protein
MLLLVMVSAASAASQKEFASYVWRAKNGEFVPNELHEQRKHLHPDSLRIRNKDFTTLGYLNESVFWQFREKNRRVNIGMVSLPLELISQIWFTVFILDDQLDEIAPFQYIGLLGGDNEFEISRGYSGNHQGGVLWEIKLDCTNLPTFTRRRDGKTGIFFEKTSAGLARFWFVHFD